MHALTTNTAKIKVSGSAGPTPNRLALIARLAARLIGTPNATPIDKSARDSLSIIQRSSGLRAHSARSKGSSRCELGSVSSTVAHIPQLWA